MFAIAINVSTEPESIRRLIPDHVLDALPDAASDEDIARAMAYHMIWKIQQPKKMETVRKHYLAQWWFLEALAEIDPEMFDEVQMAFADRAYAFDCPEVVG